MTAAAKSRDAADTVASGRRLRFTEAADYPASPWSTVAYPKGWEGLVTDAVADWALALGVAEAAEAAEAIGPAGEAGEAHAAFTA